MCERGARIRRQLAEITSVPAMPRRLSLLLAFAVALASWSAAEAHHSLAGMYDQSRRVTLDGTIAQFQFVNPHPFLMIDVQDPNGTMQS